MLRPLFCFSHTPSGARTRCCCLRFRYLRDGRMVLWPTGPFQERSGLRCFDEIRAAFADHYAGRIGVAADDLGHHARIGNPEPV